MCVKMSVLVFDLIREYLSQLNDKAMLNTSNMFEEEVFESIDSNENLSHASNSLLDLVFDQENQLYHRIVLCKKKRKLKSYLSSFQ